MNKFLILCLIAGFSFSACNNQHANEEALTKEAVLKQVKDSLALDSFRKADAEKKAIAEETPRQQVAPQASAPAPTNTGTANDVYEDQGNTAYDENTDYEPGYEQANEPVSQPNENVPVATAPEKKGWSDAAKGTAIGAGAGAILGTIIGKGKGAAIGAAVGGAGGYAIGRKKDRQSGRVQKK